MLEAALALFVLVVTGAILIGIWIFTKLNRKLPPLTSYQVSQDPDGFVLLFNTGQSARFTNEVIEELFSRLQRDRAASDAVSNPIGFNTNL